MMQRSFWIRSIPSELAADAASPWTIKGLMGNYPGTMGQMSAFHSVMIAGHQPHPIEAHDEEELIVSLSGSFDVLTPERTYPVGPGGFVHFPPNDPHAIRGAGPGSTRFLVFKWTWQDSGQAASRGAVPFVLERYEVEHATEQGVYRRRVCENQPLANGGRLVVDAIHMTSMTGYPAHMHHDHDVMMLLLRGQLHGLGHVTSAPALIYYSAKTSHGIQPLSPEPIEMLAFEFHRP